MPEITDKDHVKELRDATKLSSFKLVNSYDYNTPDAPELRYSIFSSNIDVLLCVFDEENVIGNVDLSCISNSMLEGIFNYKLLQVSSVVVDKEYRGLGIAPRAYKFLCENYTIISDNVQTIFGANLWKIKLASDADLSLSVVTNFPTNPQIFLNEYSYNENSSLDPEIWGVDFDDPRFIPTYDINACITDSKKNVVLVAAIESL